MMKELGEERDQLIIQSSELRKEAMLLAESQRRSQTDTIPGTRRKVKGETGEHARTRNGSRGNGK